MRIFNIDRLSSFESLIKLVGYLHMTLVGAQAASRASLHIHISWEKIYRYLKIRGLTPYLFYLGIGESFYI